jgi:hypothetical protein
MRDRVGKYPARSTLFTLGKVVKMKHFAALVVLLCVGFMVLGCTEKKPTPTPTPPGVEKTEGEFPATPDVTPGEEVKPGEGADVVKPDDSPKPEEPETPEDGPKLPGG